MDESRDDRRWTEEQTGAPHAPPERPEEASSEEDMADEDGGYRFEDLSVPPEGDDDARFEFDDDIPPPPWLDAAREAEEPRHPPRAARIVAFMVVILAGLGIVMTAQSLRLYGRQTQTQATLDASVDRLAAVYASPEAGEAARRRIAWLRKALGDGDYAQARQAIESLEKPPAAPPGAGVASPGGPDIPGPGDVLPGGGQGQIPSPAQAEDLSLDVQQFFSENAELWEAFFGFTHALVQLRRAGAPIDELEQMRASMIEAARTGQADRVEQLLEEAREKIALGTGENLPDALKDKLALFGQAFQRAQREGRDVRRAANLAQRSEDAARNGNFERAEALLDQALAAVRGAPRGRAMRMPRPGQPGQRGAPPVGAELGFLRFLSQMFDRVMKAEEADLTRVWESINNAAVAIREHNAQQVRDILGNAVDAMHDIGTRRREMVQTIQQAQQQARSAAPRQGPTQEQRRERTEAVLARIDAILGRVRALTPEQYEAAKEQIARDLMAALTAPVPAAAPSSAPERELTPEERVRAKMRLAGEMYMQLKTNTDADTTELDTRFEEVRRLITEHDYEAAEELLDATVAIMRESAAQAEGHGPAGLVGPGEFDVEDATQLHLRGLGDEPIMAPPPAIAPTDQPDTAEEGEQ